ncbi:MAG TPA: hypothetical protein VFC03_10710 [Acidimicrobiales bacterium]|nr:hypothetical protein [Acidimicrobiales bacterium]
MDLCPTARSVTAAATRSPQLPVAVVHEILTAAYRVLDCDHRTSIPDGRP